MSLYTHPPNPSEEQRGQILQVLAHADPPIPYQLMLAHRPEHRVSSWRGLAAWIMNRHHGVPQECLAQWFGLTHSATNRLIRRVDEMVVNNEPETEHYRRVIESILKEGE